MYLACTPLKGWFALLFHFLPQETSLYVFECRIIIHEPHAHQRDGLLIFKCNSFVCYWWKQKLVFDRFVALKKCSSDAVCTYTYNSIETGCVCRMHCCVELCMQTTQLINQLFCLHAHFICSNCATNYVHAHQLRATERYRRRRHPSILASTDVT